MPELLLLVGDVAKANNDNHLRFTRGFAQAGWKVIRADHEAIEVRHNALLVAGRDPRSYDLVWPLGFGQQVTFFDRMQLLAATDGIRFVNSPDVLVYLHGKHRWLEAMPETHTSTRPEYLYRVLSSGGDWVLKPTAGSFGRDVYLLREGQARLTEIEEICTTLGSGYLMAQRFVPGIRDGEKRTLVAGGSIIGTYLRIPTDGLTSNLTNGGNPEQTCLTGDEMALIEPIARQLAELGAGFSAIDTVYPFLMEVNVANPGGLETLETIEGRDHTDQVVRAIIGWAAAR